MRAHAANRHSGAASGLGRAIRRAYTDFPDSRQLGIQMKKRHAMWLLAAGFLSSPSAYSQAPHLDLSTELDAASPHASLGDQAEVVGRLVGTWDVEYTNFGKDGAATRRTGEVIVGWVMDGRAMQILWIVHPSGTRKDREVYANLNWFDPKSKTWRSAFVDPEHGSVARFTGGPVGPDRFVLETQDFGSARSRWSANEIRPEAFVWRDESSVDEGKTWTLQAEYRMKRRSGGPAAR